MDIKAGTIGTGAGREMAPRAQSRRADASAALLALAAEQLAPYKRPKRIVFVDALPRNALGKVTKQVLRDR